MDPVQAFVLGLVQGLTEWLPVSSSGHLVIFQQAMGVRVPVTFDVLLHVVTALVVLAYLRKEVAEMFASLGRSLKRRRAGERFSQIQKQEEGSLLAWLIVVGSFPTAIIGFVLRSMVEPLFQSLLAVGVALIITGVVLALTFMVRTGGGKRLRTLDALVIGVAQGIAIIPGISRSGSTISLGLFLGADRVKVVKYSFLLAVPAILGAGLAGMWGAGWESLAVDPLALLVALISAAVFGVLALRLLLAVVSRARLYLFAPYCIAIGTVLVAVIVL